MSEGFLWVLVLHGIGFFMLGWGVLRIWISITNTHADELDRLRDANARLKALARLKAYREMYEGVKGDE